MTMPKIGQVVLYTKAKDRVMAAIVVCLNNDDTVNIVAFTERGGLMPMLSVPADELGEVDAAKAGKVEEGSGE